MFNKTLTVLDVVMTVLSSFGWLIIGARIWWCIGYCYDDAVREVFLKFALSYSFLYVLATMWRSQIEKWENYNGR